ncbi:hypothetical protein Q2T52_11225 [Rhizobium oryzicola]|uniref:Uncharacterized protein n=1 Tax=Rhizobium oryzicola TaxID=1232668 RepID=A0ABT8SW57_9HYPH|nr:hypothetical protein [Rhizobium oryzicola]MDO1582654.1 hypothetical protein [Rhizobium oryzicola]
MQQPLDQKATRPAVAKAFEVIPVELASILRDSKAAWVFWSVALVEARFAMGGAP